MDPLLANSFPIAPVDGENIRVKLTSKAVEVIQSIVLANQNSMANCQKELKLLDSGVFYPDEYYRMLKILNQQRRIDFLVTNGNFWHGFASPSHFKMIPRPKTCETPTGVIGCCFVLKEGVLASDALASLRQKTSLIGCAEVVQIAYYEAIKQVLGEAKFNTLFASDSPTPLTLGQSRLVVSPFAFLIKGLPSKGKFKKGDVVQFKNSPVYSLKNPTGSGFSYITLCYDDTPGKERFTTLGLDPKGSTHQGVKAALTEEFNKPSLGATVLTDDVGKLVFTPERLSKEKELKNAKISAEQLEELQGGEVMFHAEIAAELITMLASAPAEIGRIILDTWIETHSKQLAGLR